MYTHTHTYIHTHTYTHIQLIHTYMHTHVHIQKYSHILYTRVHTYTHTHTLKPSLHPLRASEKTTYSSSHQINLSGPQATVCHQSKTSFKGSLQMGSLPWGPSADPHMLSKAPESLQSEGCVVCGDGIEILDSGPDI